MKKRKSLIQKMWNLTGLFLIYQVIIRVVRHYINFPAPAFIGRFLDSDLRRMLQPADKLIQRSSIIPGMHVLEIGCGSGAFTTFIARKVGEEGNVDALDIQPAMLAQFREKLLSAECADIHNVTLHEGNAYALPFNAHTFDVVYMVTVLPEIPDQHRALIEVARVLKPTGILAVTEFLVDPDYPLCSETIQRGMGAGFDVVGVYGNLWNYTVQLKQTLHEQV